MKTSEEFCEDPDPNAGFDVQELFLRLEGYEGPLDLLLDMARKQKLDLSRLSMLELAEQYLQFIDQARSLRIEVAAEYLVMAAWLTYLKSRLLLPSPAPDPDDDAPTGQEMAEALAFQLKRLEAMRNAADTLMQRPVTGRDVFARGAPEGLPVDTRVRYAASLVDLLRAYGAIQRRTQARTYHEPSFDLVPLDAALERMRTMLGHLPRTVWTELTAMIHGLVSRGSDPLKTRSALAGGLTAALELAKEGKARLRQDRPFAPIYVQPDERGE